MAALAKGLTSQRALEESFGVPLTELDKVLRAHLRKCVKQAHLVELGVVAQVSAPRPVPRVEVFTRLAANALAHTYLASRELAARGIEMLEEELRNGPHLQLAVILMEFYARTGDREVAGDLLRTAIEQSLHDTVKESLQARLEVLGDCAAAAGTAGF